MSPDAVRLGTHAGWRAMRGRDFVLVDLRVKITPNSTMRRKAFDNVAENGGREEVSDARGKKTLPLTLVDGLEVADISLVEEVLPELLG